MMVATRDAASERTRAVLLANGDTALVRPMVANDRDAVAAMFYAMSEENVYLRFFTLGTSTIARHLDHLFDRRAGSMAFVVECHGTIVGVADIEPEGDNTAEIALVVADNAHGLGIGTILLEHAAAAARAAGIEWFVADVLSINHAMLEVFAESGFMIETHRDHDDVSVRMNTTPGPTEIAAASARSALARARAASRT
jgi:GNAT superfamily N-acetyltransferase